MNLQISYAVLLRTLEQKKRKPAHGQGAQDRAGLDVTTLTWRRRRKAQVAGKLGIGPHDWDDRPFPTNVEQESNRRFVAVLQDKAAPGDRGTPTCMTWQGARGWRGGTDEVGL